MSEDKHPGGRPTTYDPAYCEQIIACMSKGYSKTAFAGEIGASRQLLIDWTKAHPEFLDAVRRAEAARVHCLETTLLKGETGPKVTSHIFALKNADPEEWRDKQEHNVTGDITVQILRFTDDNDPAS